MKRKALHILLIFILAALSVSGQQIELYMVNIRVKVVNIDDGEPVPFAHVINPRVRGGTTTNADGYFTIQILTEDTLIIRSMGFVDHYFYLTEFPPKDMYTIKLKPVRVQLSEITVTDRYRLKENLGLPQAKPLDIPIELRGDAFNEKPNYKTFFVSPISYLQYFLSEREKRKRETLNVIRDDKQWNLFAVYQNLTTIKKLTGLDGENADRFMIYCNIHNRLPYSASQMEIEFQMMDLYFKFMKEQEKANE